MLSPCPIFEQKTQKCKLPGIAGLHLWWLHTRSMGFELIVLSKSSMTSSRHFSLLLEFMLLVKSLTEIPPMSARIKTT
jgi:hypothetical protein